MLLDSIYHMTLKGNSNCIFSIKIQYFSILNGCYFLTLLNTVKPVLSGHSNLDPTKILMTIGSLMKVGSIAECSSATLLTCIKL